MHLVIYVAMRGDARAEKALAQLEKAIQNLPGHHIRAETKLLKTVGELQSVITMSSGALIAAVVTCRGRYPNANARLLQPRDIAERGFEPASWTKICAYRIAIRDRDCADEYLYETMLTYHCKLTGQKPPLRTCPKKKRQSGYHARHGRHLPYMGQNA
ncbi:MAG TPA: hypothetical protein VHB93_01275 [Candidatus Paceibacterota bacterium]|nr:hypothetical protein [Candidatus Paceibacterota bacterium]